MSAGVAVALGGGWFVLSLYFLFANWMPRRYNYMMQRVEPDVHPIAILVVLFFSTLGLVGGPLLAGRGLDALLGG